MSDLKKQIAELYNAAALKPVCERDLNGPEWQEYAGIQEHWDAKRDEEIDDYKNGYDERVAKEVKRLIDEAGEFNLDHPTTTGDDKFNPDKIKIQAERNVRLNHEAMLEENELNRVNARYELFGRVTHRQDHRGQAREGFTRAAEPNRQPRRGGQSR